jgi:hypothetical protein
MAPMESTTIWVSLRRIRHATGSKLDDRVCRMSRGLNVSPCNGSATTTPQLEELYLSLKLEDTKWVIRRRKSKDRHDAHRQVGKIKKNYHKRDDFSFPIVNFLFNRYGSWIYDYLCNQCLTLWVRIPLGQGVIDAKLCDKVCQWLAV